MFAYLAKILDDFFGNIERPKDHGQIKGCRGDAAPEPTFLRGLQLAGLENLWLRVWNL